MEAGAYSSWRLWGQRQQCSKHCVTQGPSDHRYLTVLAVQRLLGGQQLVRVLCFCLAFCWRASKYLRSTHLPTSGNCHRKGLAINEEQFKCQSLTAFKFNVYLEILGQTIKLKNPEHCGSLNSKTWLCWLGAAGIRSREVELLLVAASGRIKFVREPESLCNSASLWEPLRGKLGSPQNWQENLRLPWRRKEARQKKIREKKWNYS